MKSKLARVAELESRIPGGRPNREIAEALGRCCDALQAAMPDDIRRYIDCGRFVQCDYTGWRSHRVKRFEMASRLQAGSPTIEDEAVLAALPTDALAVMKIDARGFVEMFKELEDLI